MRLPSFIIVGSMKAGTTSLHHWLMRHPKVCMGPNEVHFFNNDEKFFNGESEYIGMLPITYDPTALLGDDTPTYSYLEKIPERINQMVPKVKLIWLLRDPIDRSISQYWHAVRRGKETRSINLAFQDELEARTGDPFKQYLKRSKYEDQISRYFEYFEERQFLFLNFEDLCSDSSELKKKICNFLDIEIMDTKFPKSNQTNFYPRPWINRWIGNNYIPSIVKTVIRKGSSYKKNRRPELDPSLNDQLQRYFKKSVAHTYSLTGVRLKL